MNRLGIGSISSRVANRGVLVLYLFIGASAFAQNADPHVPAVPAAISPAFPAAAPREGAQSQPAAPASAPVYTISPVAELGLVPVPWRVEVAAGQFNMSPAVEIFVEKGNAEVGQIGEQLADLMAGRTGTRPNVSPTERTAATVGGILLTTGGLDAASEPGSVIGEEGYELTIKPESIVIRALKPAGVFYGMQTLRQLIPTAAKMSSGTFSLSGGPLIVPCVHIVDRPRYPHRGLLLDCSRHFLPREFIERYIDLLAFHKLNVLHWHLTDDQGWRIEIRKYPKLTDVGAWRRATRESEEPRDAAGRYGGFYEEDDIRRVVEYAKQHYVTIIPEIEMPGHALAALAAMPELSCTGGPFEVGTKWGVYDDVYCAGREETFEFIDEVVRQVCEYFPGPYVHVGGDECPKTRWKSCPRCQARMQAEHLKDENELQSYFVRRVEALLAKRGKRLIGWDEILEGGLPGTATVQSWRGFDGAVAAAKAGHDVISSPTSHCYLDYAQGNAEGEPSNMGYLPLEKVYEFDPAPPALAPEAARHILGGEGNMWTEHAPPRFIDRQVFPRLCALAEALWSPASQRDFAGFSRRMAAQYPRLDALGVFYYVPPPRFATEEDIFDPQREIVLASDMAGQIRYTLDGTQPTSGSPRYEKPIHLNEPRTVIARLFLPTGNASLPARREFVRVRTHAALPQQPDQAAVRAGPLDGFRCEYFEGQWSALPDLAELNATASSVVPQVDLSARRRDEHYALRFRGVIEVATEGEYRFFVNADDAARLRVGVGNTELHGSSPAPQTGAESSEVTANYTQGERKLSAILKPGKHPVEVIYFQAGGPARLEVTWEGPGIGRKPLAGSLE